MPGYSAYRYAIRPQGSPMCSPASGLRAYGSPPSLKNAGMSTKPKKRCRRIGRRPIDGTGRPVLRSNRAAPGIFRTSRSVSFRVPPQTATESLDTRRRFRLEYAHAPVGNEKCVYDAHYIAMMCYASNVLERAYVSGHDSLSVDREFPAIRVDDAGNCFCHGTYLLPQLQNDHDEQYVCSDYGWRCVRAGGCECGDVRCDKEALCIAPGICAK